MPPINNFRATNFVPDNIHVGGAPGVDGLPQLELGYRFYNGLGCIVTVVTRTGIQVQIPPITGTRLRAFVVRSTYATEHRVNVNTLDLLNDQGLKTSKEAQALESALFREEVRIGMGRRPTATIDYGITNEEFNNNGGSVYLTNLDLVISTLNPNYAPKHPYSLIGQREALIQGNMALTEGAFGYEIRIVDSQGRYGDRFVNIAGQVYRIRASQDESLRDGVYLTSPVPALGNVDVPLPRANYYSFEDADKQLHLYPTYNDAKTLGDPNAERDRELKDWAHRLKQEELQSREDKARIDIELDRQRRVLEQDREASKQKFMDIEERNRLHEANLREREHALARQEHVFKERELALKQVNIELKNEMEQRSAFRKDLTDALKYVPAIITGVGAVFVAIKALKK